MTHERGVNELERATRILFFDCMVITEEGEEQTSRPLTSNNKFVTSCWTSSSCKRGNGNETNDSWIVFEAKLSMELGKQSGSFDIETMDEKKKKKNTRVEKSKPKNWRMYQQIREGIGFALETSFFNGIRSFFFEERDDAKSREWNNILAEIRWNFEPLAYRKIPRNRVARNNSYKNTSFFFFIRNINRSHICKFLVPFFFSIS